ncbi:hypothetical protein PCE1_000505 [Barthelona sp. PCE]
MSRTKEKDLPPAVSQFLLHEKANLAHEKLENQRYELVLKELYDLRESYKNLSKEKEREMREHSSITMRLQNELDDKTRRIFTLEKDLERQILVVEQIEIGTEERLEKNEQQHHEELSISQKTIDNLKDELDVLNEFRENKQKYDKLHEGLEGQLAELNQNWESKYQRLQEVHSLERQRLLKRQEDIRGNMNEHIKEQVSKEVFKRNKDVVVKLKTLDEEMRWIVADNKKLREENVGLKAQLERVGLGRALEKDMISEQLNMAIGKDKKIAGLQERLQEIEKKYTELRSRHKNSLQQQRDDLRGLLEEQALEIQALRKLVVMKNQKLKKLRVLSQYILAQRSDLEKFLLNSIRNSSMDESEILRAILQRINQATVAPPM